MIRITLSYESSNLAQYDNVVPVSTSLTERQAAILLGVSIYMTERDAWEEMTDSEWDDLSNVIANALEGITLS